MKGDVTMEELKQTYENARVMGKKPFDIDAITGGFNLQAAWTTAYTVAQAIASE